MIIPILLNLAMHSVNFNSVPVLPTLLSHQQAETIQVQNLNLAAIEQGWGNPTKNRSVGGNPLTVAGHVFTTGIGTHAESHFLIQLNGKALRFSTSAGLDDEAKDTGSVGFQIWVDKKLVTQSEVMRRGTMPTSFIVDLKVAKVLELVVTDGGDGNDNDHADWLEPVITAVPGASKAIYAYVPPPEPMPQIADNLRRQPELHNPLVVGCTAGRAFEYRVPCSGAGVLKFSASDLPNGLSINEDTGIISGTVEDKGGAQSTIHVVSKFGKDSRKLTIDSNGLLALTPPMGWNSWNVWAGSVTQQKIVDAATALRKTRLADFGYQFVNIDDTWEAGRNDEGMIQSNDKFPDMAALSASVHGLGLKLGIYSSPGPTTCAGFTASYKFETQDAQQYALWGVDYLKYDWCSYGGIDPNPDLAGFQKPYIVMRNALDSVNRDIVFSYCQYGMGDVWNWGRKTGGNLWRTTGDITDTWKSMSANGFGGSKWAIGAGPGGWNDPDMLVVGKLGWSGSPHPTRLTPNEQITHISLWSMLAAPLIIGCDLTQIDKFTFNVLTNPEVLDVDQDMLGKAGTVLVKHGDTEVWSRPLVDGSYAIGLFNRGEDPTKIAFDPSDLGLKGKLKYRILWIRKDGGTHVGPVSYEVNRHGCVMLRVTPK